MQLFLEIGLLSFIAIIYYLYQKRKITYYVAKEFELLCLKLLGIINQNISTTKNSPEDTKKISLYCQSLEKGSINIKSLMNIKEIFEDNEEIQIISDQIIDILNDKPVVSI